LIDYSIVEVRVHEESNFEQPIQLGLDPYQRALFFRRQKQSNRSDHFEAKGSGESSGGLFIQYEPLGTQFQTQTDDLMFAWTNRAADYVRLKPQSEGLNHKPLGQSWYGWLHFFRNSGGIRIWA